MLTIESLKVVLEHWKRVLGIGLGPSVLPWLNYVVQVLKFSRKLHSKQEISLE